MPAFLFAGEPVLANDTMANFAAGGLTFSRTDAVAMVSEDLYLSTDEVRVAYRFRNLTGRDVAGTVAFPMPDIKADHFSPVAYPDGPPENPMRFSVTVDGRSVPVALAKKAMVDGIDVTDTLRELRIPLEPYAEEVEAALKRLDTDNLRRLASRRIIQVLFGDGSEYGENGREGPIDPGSEIVPNWVLSAAYHWQQTFPAGRDIEIRHRYKPSVGGSVLPLDAMARARNEAELLIDGEGACLDRDFVSGARRWAERERRKQGGQLSRRIDYVLVTGGNWAGPIGSFTLTVDKGRPGNLVSFCGEGVKKIGPTLFRMTKTDFTPKENLRVLILDTGRS